MGTFIWLLFMTIIGGVLGETIPNDPHMVLGAVIGFVIGLILRVMIAGGSGAADGALDIFDAFD